MNPLPLSCEPVDNDLAPLLANDPRRHSLSAQVHEALRTAILQAKLLPGETLSENTLSQRLQVGRTPVREALQRLANEGLVKVMPQRGSSVALIRLQSIREALFIRKAIECALLSHLVRQETLQPLLDRLATCIEAQSEAVQQQSLQGTLSKDADFHRSLALYSAFPGAWQVIEHARDLHQRIRAIALPELNSGAVAVADHRQILSALDARDEASAVAAMQQHIERNFALALDVAKAHPDYFEDAREFVATAHPDLRQ